MEFREHRLANGLEVVAECNPRAYSAGFGFFVKTGSRDETAEVSGVSHFLEHMTFKGTLSGRSGADVNRELDEIGSHSNAYTSEEQTVYYATVLPEYQERAVELLADMMRPALREGDFETEKQVILEEIAKYDDQPPFGAFERAMAAHFGDHPLGRSILGTVKSVGALSVEQMVDYFRSRYSPGNIVLAAAGAVDFDRLVEQAERYCEAWQPFPPLHDPTRGQRVPTHRRFEVHQHPQATQQYVIQVADGPSRESEDRFAARILTTILGDDSGSRMFWELVDKGLAEYAALGPHEFEGSGIVLTYLCCEPDEAENNLQRIRDLLAEATRSGVTREEVRQAKNKICSHIVLSSERSSNRLFSVGSNWTQRREYRTVRELVSSYEDVTEDEVAAMLAQYPLVDNTTVAVGPLADLLPPQ